MANMANQLVAPSFKRLFPTLSKLFAYDELADCFRFVLGHEGQPEFVVGMDSHGVMTCGQLEYENLETDRPEDVFEGMGLFLAVAKGKKIEDIIIKHAMSVLLHESRYPVTPSLEDFYRNNPKGQNAIDEIVGRYEGVIENISGLHPLDLSDQLPGSHVSKVSWEMECLSDSPIEYRRQWVARWMNKGGHNPLQAMYHPETAKEVGLSRPVTVSYSLFDRQRTG